MSTLKDVHRKTTILVQLKTSFKLCLANTRFPGLTINGCGRRSSAANSTHSRGSKTIVPQTQAAPSLQWETKLYTMILKTNHKQQLGWCQHMVWD